MKTKENKTPQWMVTFADLMALMMTFFVLLYSFSKVDEQKYLSMVQSISLGFDGVQWIKRRISPDDPVGPTPGVIQPPVPEITPPEPALQRMTLSDLFNDLKDVLQKEIKDGTLTLKKDNNNITIQFPSQVSFRSGSNILLDDFLKTMQHIATILEKTHGKITVSGHTDNVPVSNNHFRSNWDLSSSRAVTVAHYIIENSLVKPSDLKVVGYADTVPLASNDSKENRARNRRVEIDVTLHSAGDVL